MNCGVVLRLFAVNRGPLIGRVATLRDTARARGGSGCSCACGRFHAVRCFCLEADTKCVVEDQRCDYPFHAYERSSLDTVHIKAQWESILLDARTYGEEYVQLPGHVLEEWTGDNQEDPRPRLHDGAFAIVFNVAE